MNPIRFLGPLALWSSLLLSGCGGGDGGPTAIPFYPDTDEAPVIALRGDFINFLDDRTVSLFPMGLPEGQTLKPGEEIEITRDIAGEIVVAPISGVVTFVYAVDGNPDNTNVSIRYGRNYIVKHFHLSSVPDSIIAGLVIDAGEAIGVTQSQTVDSGIDGGWELGVIKREDGGCSYVCPYDYFDDESKLILDELIVRYPPEGSAEAPYRWCYEEKVDGSAHCNELDALADLP